jgi:hypothetical protein
MYKAKYKYCAVSQASCRFLLFGSKIFFQYPVLKHHKPMVSAEYDRPSFTHTWSRENWSAVYFKLYVFSRKRKNKNTLNGPQFTEYKLMYVTSVSVYVHCCLHVYVADADTFRLCSDSFVTVDRAFLSTCFYLIGIYELCSGPKLTKKRLFSLLPFLHLLTETSLHCKVFLTRSSRFVLDNPQTLHHSRNLSPSREPDGSLPRSQQPTTWPYQTSD